MAWLPDGFVTPGRLDLPTVATAALFESLPPDRRAWARGSQRGPVDVPEDLGYLPSLQLDPLSTQPLLECVEVWRATVIPADAGVDRGVGSRCSWSPSPGMFEQTSSGWLTALTSRSGTPSLAKHSMLTASIAREGGVERSRRT